MPPSAAVTPIAPQFDAFLFAPVGEDGNGMMLSVLSALARLDMDPWQEAEGLARLPKARARERLASLIAMLPGAAAQQPEPERIAARLIPLLPQQQASPMFPARPERRPDRPATLPVMLCLVYAALFMMVALGLQLTLASRERLAPHDAAPAAAGRMATEPRAAPPAPR